MRYRILVGFCVLIVVFVGLGAKKKPVKTTPTAPAPWQVVFMDDFSDGKIDTAKWNIGDRNTVNYDGGENTYDVSNAFNENNALFIRAVPGSVNKDGTRKYVSSRVTTKGKFSFQYGKIEVRARLPGTKGVWPAIWLLPTDGSWPPEIDIMELVGDEPRTVYMTQHYGTRANRKQKQGTYKGPDFTQDFHTFSVEWDANSIRWLVDGEEQHKSTTDVPTKPMYLIINTSIGGEWPGNPDASSVFPNYLIVDYVKVYRKGK